MMSPYSLELVLNEKSSTRSRHGKNEKLLLLAVTLPKRSERSSITLSGEVDKQHGSIKDEDEDKRMLEMKQR